MERACFHSFALSFFLSPLFLFAQSPGEKLEAVYGEGRVQELSSESPKIHEYLLFKLEHGYKLIPAREGKGYQEVERVLYYAKKREEKERISARELLKKVQNGSFNLMKCHLDRKRERRVLYELKGTGKVLVLPSEKALSKEYNSKE